MIVVIRISGLVEVPVKINETLFRMRMRRKYSAVLVHATAENKKLLQHVRNFVAYGPIDKEMLHELLSKRAQTIDKKKKINVDDVISHLDKKTLDELNIKPFFRLHPPRGGIESKVHYPIRHGVLGDNKEDINELLRRML